MRLRLRHTRKIRRRPYHWTPACWVAVIGMATTLLFAAILSHRLSPILEAIAVDEVRNEVNLLLNKTVAEVLEERQLGYDDIVNLERDDSGAITSASSDIVAINGLNQEIVSRLTQQLNQIDLHQLEIPIGNLLGIDLLSGRGPNLQVQALWVGTVDTEIENEFSEAGINQTLHRVMLTVRVPTTILLAGNKIECQVDTQICLAESVIIGTVPGTYIRLDG